MSYIFLMEGVLSIPTDSLRLHFMSLFFILNIFGDNVFFLLNLEHYCCGTNFSQI